MLLTRRFLLNSLMATPNLAAQHDSGTAIVMRLTDRRVVHIDNPDFAAHAVLPPASTIKPFVIFSLLESGKLRADDLFSCSRRLQINDHILNCVHPPTPIPMNAARALAYSCNGAVAHFALRFSSDELWQSLVRFGFTSASGLVPSPEAAGIVKRTDAGPQCQLQALGEEGIAVTPLALLLAYARLAQRLLDATYAPVLEGLEGAVEFGTAQAAHMDGVRVAGKTGSIVLASGSPAAWFAGFAPSRDPALALVVLTPGRSGGSDAAPIAASLLKRYL
jgi:cell division protein FtsI/penicillin-binding protein 2